MDHLSRSALNLISEMDARLRQLERQAATGDPGARARFAKSRQRVGQSLSIKEFQHVPHSEHPGHQDYRAGYKAGWSHAHNGGNSPAELDTSKGPEYAQGFQHGMNTGQHTGRFKAHFDASYDAIERSNPDWEGSNDHAEAANAIARNDIFTPHRDAMASGYTARVKRLQSGKPPSEEELAHNVDNWSHSGGTSGSATMIAKPAYELRRQIDDIEDSVARGDNRNHPADLAYDVGRYSAGDFGTEP